MPAAIPSCCIVVDRDKQHVLLADFMAYVINTLHALTQRDVLLFGREQVRINASAT